LNLNIQDENNNPLYKLAGTLDDIMFSSHVVRGRHQLVQGLTDRQAYIHATLRIALESLNEVQKEEFDSVVSSESAKHIEVTRRPIPIFAPLIYSHIGEVMDEGGNPLSKRSTSKTISTIRADATFMPEAIVAFFTNDVLSSIQRRQNTEPSGFRVLTEVGLDAYYSFLAEHMIPSDLDLLTRSQKVTTRQIRRWECRILHESPAWAFQKYVKRIPYERLPHDRQASFVSRVLEIRSQTHPKYGRVFSCWNDVNLLADLIHSPGPVVARLKRSRMRRDIKAILLLPEDKFNRSIEQANDRFLNNLRKGLFNGMQGPRIRLLANAVGIEHLNDLGERM
jgi:hypothetical protein